MQQGKFIVIEGGDGSGKTMQVALLLAALSKVGTPVSTIKFPRKEAFFGRFVYECLDGAHGDFLALDPHFAAFPYALDQGEARPLLEEMMRGGHVIADRYSPSNLAHQAAKCRTEAAQREAIAFIERMTYTELHARRPDMVLYLDVPAKTSAELSKKQGKQDQHEADVSYQERVREVYRMLAREREDWRQIACAPGGHIRSAEDIHEEIRRLVQPILGIDSWR